MSKSDKLFFKKINYMLLLGGIGLLILGYIIITMETEPYGFGPLGLTIGPIFIMAGFILEFFAILYKPKNSNNNGNI